MQNLHNGFARVAFMQRPIPVLSGSTGRCDKGAAIRHRLTRGQGAQFHKIPLGRIVLASRLSHLDEASQQGSPLYDSLDDIPAARTKPVPYRHTAGQDDVRVPDYLERHYWWAYARPWSIKIFDRLWLVNLILLGNYKRLVRSAMAEFTDPSLGKVLQMACVYGDLTLKLAKRAAAQKGTLDVIDVLPIQLKNLKWKLPKRTPARLLRMDATAMDLPEAHYDHVLIFFLLHELPEAERALALKQALRVLKPGGKLILVDYGPPSRWNPLRYLMPPFLALLEPFALSLVRRPLASRLPVDMVVEHTPYFGGFYQKVVATKPL